MTHDAITQSQGLVKLDNAAVVCHRLKTITTPSQPSTANCNLDIYTLLLLAVIAEQKFLEMFPMTASTAFCGEKSMNPKIYLTKSNNIIIFIPNSEELEQLTYYDFKQMHSIHGGIECYHRAIKQLYGIERFMVRTTDALKTHFFCAIRAFTQLELMRAEQLIENWYEQSEKFVSSGCSRIHFGTPQTEDRAEGILDAYCQCVSPRLILRQDS